LKFLLASWRDVVPLAGLIALGSAGAFFLFRKEPENADELERQRRAYLNRIGRIVEGHILEFVDRPDGALDPAQAPKWPAPGKRAVAGQRNGAKKLLFYTYSISGVTYETAQDVTGLEEQAHLKRIAVGQTASVKYDPANPSNSILLADDWSGVS
jgi:hypothetical protein